METATQDKLANAKANAKASFEHIKELVEALEAERKNEDQDLNEEAERAIHEHPLSVEVRSDWYGVSGGSESGKEPAEYRILISTGGPAVQLTGTLNEDFEPETAELECQDWFQPWTCVTWHELAPDLEPSKVGEILLAYAGCFYFGE